MAKKIKPINYTSRDFDSIKQELVDYAKRYYPDSFQDFNEASFGSLMLDTVSYVGDILSFYVDYQANESFLNSATEKENIIRLSRQLGYKYREIFASTGEVAFFVLVPNQAAHPGPDHNYYPTLLEGTTLTADGGSSFILAEDVHFDSPSSEIVVGRVDETTGEPTYYAVKATGKVVSGKIVQETITIGDYERFRKIRLQNNNILEIISVTDADGNEYYEVDNLSQNVIYQNIARSEAANTDYAETLRPLIVPRRFVFDYDGSNYFMQFGYGSEDEILENPVADPSEVVLKQTGRNYTTDITFDPYNLLKTDKLGVSPSNTVLTIKMRINPSSNVNAPVGTLRQIDDLRVEFADKTLLDSTKLLFVMNSIQAFNESPITGDSTPVSPEEIRQRAMSNFSTQNRAVTAKDYEQICYGMPAKFGSIKRCKILVDESSFKRNLNLYVLVEGNQQKLAVANSSIKQNLRTWLSNYKMINDTVDIMDGKIINIGIKFNVIAETNSNKQEVYDACVSRIKSKIMNPWQMGERLYITDIYSELNKVRGVVDTSNVTITNKSGDLYSDVEFSISSNMSPDGRYIVCPLNACFEIKFPDVDITGVVK